MSRHNFIRNQTDRDSAFDIIPDDEQVLIELDYECPSTDCDNDTMTGEPVGHECLCWCEECRADYEDKDEDFPVYGIHDLLEQYVLIDSETLTLRLVPADRVTIRSE